MKKKILIIVGVILLIIGIVFGAIGLHRYLSEINAGKSYEDMKAEFSIDPLVEIPHLGDGPVEVPVDFASLTAKYPDVYAWIRIPGTRVDYPIVQREGNNAYYLNHTVEGKKRSEGAIYTEDYNHKDFEDANTVIYGHNMKNGSMFKALHKYRDRKFMEEHSKILIYQEGRILTYKVFAAYIYDSRHLMMSFDFEDENVFRNYLNSILTKKDMRGNIDVTVSVTSADRIITLSTCNNNDKQRYLVQAVLLSIQE